MFDDAAIDFLDGRCDRSALGMIPKGGQDLAGDGPVGVTSVDVDAGTAGPIDDLTVDVTVRKTHIFNAVGGNATREILSEPVFADGAVSESGSVDHQGMAFEDLGTNVVVAFDAVLVATAAPLVAARIADPVQTELVVQNRVVPGDALPVFALKPDAESLALSA